MRRWFWRLYWPAAVVAMLLLLAPLVGPSLELSFAPIRSNQRVTDVIRTANRLQWTWISDKLRLAVSDNTDVFLERADGDRSYPEVFDCATGKPWHKNGVLPVGHSEKAFCILLPPDVMPAEPLVLRQTIHYRGWFGLWTVLVPLPEVVSRPQPP